jgi:hypothetical protein
MKTPEAMILKEEAMVPDTVAAYIKFVEDTITSLEEKRRRQGDEKAKLERKLGLRSHSPRPPRRRDDDDYHHQHGRY